MRVLRSSGVLLLLLMIFVWFAGLLAVGALQLFYIYDLLISLFFSSVCYGMVLLITRRWWRGRPVFPTVGVMLLGFCAAMWFSTYVDDLARMATWNPVGTTRDAGLGGPPCNATQLATASNGANLVAETRRTFCDFGFGVSAFTFFVFVHDKNTSTGRQNLVFRYSSAPTAGDMPPRIHWRNQHTLDVFLRREAHADITKNVRNQGAVTIAVQVE